MMCKSSYIWGHSEPLLLIQGDEGARATGVRAACRTAPERRTLSGADGRGDDQEESQLGSNGVLTVPQRVRGPSGAPNGVPRSSFLKSNIVTKNRSVSILAQAAVFYDKIVSVAGNRVIVNHAEQHLRTHSRAERPRSRCGSCAGGKDGAGCRYERVCHGEG